MAKMKVSELNKYFLSVFVITYYSYVSIIGI